MDKLDLSWLPYEKCKGEFVAFRNRNRDVVRDESYFEWRFLKRPASQGPLIVWASIAGKKVGSLSLVPHDFFVDGRSVSMGILGDISVLSECRGRGVARRMFEYLAVLDEVKALDGCVVLPNEEAASPLERAGWKNVSKVERYVKILDVSETLERKVGAISRVASPAINALLSLSYDEVFLWYKGGYAGKPAEGFDERFDSLWKAVSGKGTAMSVRDRAHLHWRYASHPSADFKIFTLVRSGNLCGYIVYHTDGKVAYVTDILSVEEDGCRDLLIHFFANHIRKRSIASSIHLRVNRSWAISLPLWKFNFIRRADYQRFMVLPAGADGGVFTDGGRWFLTAGDKDV